MISTKTLFLDARSIGRRYGLHGRAADCICGAWEIPGLALCSNLDVDPHGPTSRYLEGSYAGVAPHVKVCLDGIEVARRPRRPTIESWYRWQARSFDLVISALLLLPIAVE